MSFCDQTILSDPFADSNAVLVSGTESMQESDFAPKLESNFEPDSKPMLRPILAPTNELEQSSKSKIDEAIEMLDSKNEKDKQDPILKLESDDPVKAPSFELTGESSDKSPTQTESETAVRSKRIVAK